MFEHVETMTQETVNPQPPVNGSQGDIMSLFHKDTMGEAPQPEHQEASPEPAGNPIDPNAQPQGAEAVEQAEGGEDEASHSLEEVPQLAPEMLDYVVRFKENGEEIEQSVTGLIDAFQRGSHINRKAQELAQQQQQVGALYQETQQKIQQYDTLLADQEAQLEALLPEEPDWGQMAIADPNGYQTQRAAWDHLQTQLKSVQEKRQQLAQEQQQKGMEQYQAYMHGQNAALLEAMPELDQPEKRQSFFEGIATYAQNEYGFTPQEMGMIGDHRLFLIADKARQWDALQAQANGKREGGKNIPTLTPRTGQSPTDTPSARNLSNARKQLAQSGSVKAAAAVFGQKFGTE